MNVTIGFDGWLLQEMIRSSFAAHHRCIKHRQMALLCQRAQQESPLWLVTVCSQLRTASSDQLMLQELEEMPAGLLE